jgi:hypothetical protein
MRGSKMNLKKSKPYKRIQNLSKRAIKHIEEAMFLLTEAERFAVSNDIDFGTDAIVASLKDLKRDIEIRLKRLGR